MEPTIKITETEYRNLCRSADTLDWLQSRGLCWRGVDTAFPGWQVGGETQWFYPPNGDVRDKVDEHLEFLANAGGMARELAAQDSETITRDNG
jgi:hypothetical protein